MLSLSTTTGYAIQALACMDGPQGRPLLVREIAAKTGIAKPYLAKIVHALGQRGLVETKRGHSGGVTLARRPDEISLYEITEAVEGQGCLNRCLLGLAKCTDDRACPSHIFWKPTRERIAARLRSMSLSDVAEFERANLERREALSQGKRLMESLKELESRVPPGRPVLSPRKARMS